MANNVIKRVWNQNRMVSIEDLKGMTFQAESGGHTFQISGVDDAGNVIALSGSVAGVFLRPDNTDVAITGSASGGVVSVTLPANCYDVPGRFGLTIFVTANGQKTAVYAAMGTVSRTSSGTVSPGTTSDVVDLINRINAAVTTIPASWTGLMADIAPTYSDAAVYPVGAYCYYNGDLYRCTTAITTAESWTAGHWTQAVLGNDVSDLKSAINNLRDVYPWDINAKLGSTIINPTHAEIVKNSILDIHLFGANNREKYYMNYFNRSNDGNSICVIKIAKSDGTEVCGYSQWNRYFPSVERINLNEFNNSGISGFVIVNWSAMPTGTAWSVNATNGFENFGLSEFTIFPNDDIEILLPDTIYWCEGREMSIYFENILLCDNLKNYQIDCVGNAGKQQNERFVIDSPVIGDYYLTINVYTANYGRLIITKTTIIHVISNVGTGADKKVCFIGDSWTDNPTYISDLQALYGDETDTDTLTLIGTRYPWGQYTGAPKTEGRAGWSARDYVLSASVGGVTNAFYNPTSRTFDFSYYLSSTGQSTPDIVSIFLGINDVAKGILPMRSIESFDIMISSIKNASSNIKIALVLTPPPCQSQDGFGKNNGVGECYWQQKKGAFNFAKMLYEKYKDDSSIFFVPVMSSVDMFYNVASEEVAPNAYNTDITIRRITDNVHCNKFGYAQVADAFYGCLKHF
jgi:lysophospholipase L1-like esterase